jgi:hypothetical protein
VEEGLHALQKRSSFGCCVDGKAIETTGEPHISKETSRVFVKVKEGPRLQAYQVPLASRASSLLTGAVAISHA